MIANYMIVVAILLLILLLIVPCKEGEGFEDDYLSLAIQALNSARKDRRMNDYQQMALQDAINYGNYIKNI